jgi:RNA polymerase sigma factor (sigma-70 family)
MEKIKYYDAIKGQEIEVEVTEEIEKAILDLDKDERKQRNKALKYEFSLDSVEDGENLLVDPSDNPLEALIKKETHEEKNRDRANRVKLLRKGLKSLTKNEREVMQLCFWENYTQAELSRKLGLSRAGVKYRYDAAINKLKEFILNNEK